MPVLADKAAVLDTYADIAQAGYGDSLSTAKTLQIAVDTLISTPSAENLQAAKTAWLAARVPYQQTEVYRFGNAIVDEWEGKVNAWPLDEGLIDYVGEAYGGPTDENELAVLNVIANPSFKLSGADVDASEITPELLETTLHEADENDRRTGKLTGNLICVSVQLPDREGKVIPLSTSTINPFTLNEIHLLLPLLNPWLFISP